MKIDGFSTTQTPSEVRLHILYPNTAVVTDRVTSVVSTPRTQRDKPSVPISGPNILLSDAALELGMALSQRGFYNYGGEVAVTNADGQPLEVLNPEQFRNILERYVVPVRIVDAQGTSQPQSLSLTEAKEILASELFLEQLPVVEHFNARRLPVLTDDGALDVLSEGYNERHRVLTAKPNVTYHVDRRLAAAQAVFEHLLGNFPFADQHKDKSAALAMMLTPFLAELFPAKTLVPAFLCNGDQPGLGKNLLVQLAMIPTFGNAPASVKAKDEEEMRKLLLAVAREGRRSLFFDNVTKLSSASLESFLTTPTVSGRVLGKTETITCPKSTVVFATGNNCQLSKDMERRTIFIRLVGSKGRPAIPTETYLDEPKVMESSTMILGALFTLAREWASAGRPVPSQVNPNFVRWSEIVGGILEHTGFGLPY